MNFTVYVNGRPVLTGFATIDGTATAARTYRTEHPKTSPYVFATA